MAEVVGLVASIAQLVSLAAEISKLTYSYLRDVHRASRTQKAYLREVSAFMDVLLRLEEAVQDSETLSIVKNRPSSISDDELLEWQTALNAQKANLEKNINSFLWPFKDRDLARAIQDLSRFRAILTDYTTANMSVVTAATYRATNDVKHAQERARHADDRARALSWLSTESGVLDHPKPPVFVPETGRWLIESDVVKRWHGGSAQSSYLWCHGPPGAGKTLLAAVLIDDLQKRSAPDDMVVLHYFCQFDRRKQQSELAMLISMVSQLVHTDQEHVAEAVNKLNASSHLQVKIGDLHAILAGVCKRKKVCFVVDGLDELDNVKVIVSRLQKLSEAGGKVALFSRIHPDIGKAFSIEDQLEVLADQRDIRLYVEHRFGASDFADDVGPGHPIIDLITSKAGDM
jgi:hypothetical protein